MRRHLPRLKLHASIEIASLVVLAIASNVVALGVTTSAARAQSTDEERVAAAYTRASALEREARPAEAREAWAEVMRLGPGSRMAARAERRIAWLDERSEGDFVPLTELLRFRAIRAREPDDLSRFADAVDHMPPGRVRIESELVLAQALAAAGLSDRAIERYGRIADEPTAHGDEARLARDELAGVMAEGGDVLGALETLERSGLGDSDRHGVLMRRARRAFLEPIAWGAIVLFLGLSALGTLHMRGAARARAALRDRWAIATIASIAVGPYLVARAVADESVDAFAVLGIANALGLAVAFASGAAFRGAPPRSITALRLTMVLAALGAGYLSVVYHAPSLPFA